jgi:hypothetical protein
LDLTKVERISVIGLAIEGIVSIFLLLILLATQTGSNMNAIFLLVFMPVFVLVGCAIASINQNKRVLFGKVSIIFGVIELSYVAVAYGVGFFLLRNNHNPNVHIDYYGQSLLPLTIVIAIASIVLGIWLLSMMRKIKKLKP